MRWFPSREKLLEAYREEAKADDKILVKGSRREGLEKVVAGIREEKK